MGRVELGRAVVDGLAVGRTEGCDVVLGRGVGLAEGLAVVTGLGVGRCEGWPVVDGRCDVGRCVGFPVGEMMGRDVGPATGGAGESVGVKVGEISRQLLRPKSHTQHLYSPHLAMMSCVEQLPVGGTSRHFTVGKDDGIQVGGEGAGVCGAVVASTVRFHWE